MPTEVHLTLDRHCAAKPEFFTQQNADAIIDGLNAHASQGKQFVPRLIPGGGGSGGTSLSTVVFNPTNTLSFPQAGHTYLVVLSWQASAGQFSSAGPFAQKPVCGQNAMSALWVREDSRSGPTAMAWEVYVQAGQSNGYDTLTFQGNVVAVGDWSSPNHLNPNCVWQPPALIS